MNKKTDGPSLGADIWVSAPTTFILLIYRMIKANGGDYFADLLRFLETDYFEVEDFLRTNIPSMRWLLRLAETEEGRAVLNLFGLPKEESVLQHLKGELEREDVLLDAPLEELNLKKNIPRKGGAKKMMYKTRKSSEKKKLTADPKIQFLAGMHRVTGMFYEEQLEEEFGAREMVKFKQHGIIPAKWQALLPTYTGGQELLERFGKILALAVTHVNKPKKETLAEVVATEKNIPAELEKEIVVKAPVAPEKKINGKNGQTVAVPIRNDIQAIKLVPVAEVFRVLKIIKDEAGLKDDSFFAPLLGLDAKDITNLRKGKQRLNSGHINAILNVVKVNPELLSQWL